MAASLISYSQNREDVILNALLKNVNKGFYVDVGANHPVTDSVTKHFYEHDWNGINIEPATNLFALLEADRPRDTNVKVGISNQVGELKFREYPLGDFYYAKEYIDQEVPVTTLAKLLAQYAPNKKIDFMKIDIEGYEFEAVEGNDWEKYRPTVVCIEANHVMHDWHPILEKARYVKVFWDGLNEYFVAKEHKDVIDQFSYADSIFFGPKFTSWEEERKNIAYEKIEAELQYELDRIREELVNTQDAVSHGPAMPTTFKGFINHSVWSLARGFEFYLDAPRAPLKLHVSGDQLSSLSIDEADALLRKHAQSSVVTSTPALLSLTSRLYFGAKRLALRAFGKGRV
jgi:FkbM family methyltransferase